MSWTDNNMPESQGDMEGLRIQWSNNMFKKRKKFLEAPFQECAYERLCEGFKVQYAVNYLHMTLKSYCNTLWGHITRAQVAFGEKLREFWMARKQKYFQVENHLYSTGPQYMV